LFEPQDEQAQRAVAVEEDRLRERAALPRRAARGIGAAHLGHDVGHACQRP